MTVEELIKPRYKVIADYPCMRLSFGQIFFKQPPFELCYSEQKEDPDDFPHLFKKLEWWEDRDEKDMPEYIKSWKHPINHNSRFSNIAIKCGVDIFWNSNKFSFDDNGFVTDYGGILIDCFTPITQEEYENQIHERK